MKLYDHQKKIVKEDKPVTGLFLGTGSGKTLTALLLAKGKTLVICPKTQKEDMNWEREWKDNNLPTYKPIVISKETFRRDHEKLGKFDTVIVDEAHTCLGVQPSTKWRKKVESPRTSQLFEALEKFIERTKPKRIYLATATITRSPMTVWGAAKIMGIEMDYYAFRREYYIRLPMAGREVWTAKTDSRTKDKLAFIVRNLGYVGRLEDFFDVPEQTFKTIYLDMTLHQKKRMKSLQEEWPEPIVLLGKKHQLENGILVGDKYREVEIFNNHKIDKILDLAAEFPKMVVFAKFTAQIEEISKALRKEEYRVLELTGATKDRGQLFKDANDGRPCILVVQSQVSAGWEVPDFPLMVFASMTYSVVDRLQAEGRILRANHLKKNLYITLVTKGGIDEAVAKSITNKKDFDERIYLGV